MYIHTYICIHLYLSLYIYIYIHTYTYTYTLYLESLELEGTHWISEALCVKGMQIRKSKSNPLYV